MSARKLSERELEQRRRNVEKMAALRHAQTHCKHGHKFTPENTRVAKKGKSEVRICKTCEGDRIFFSRAAWRRVLEINPDHPKHGTWTGANAGCPCIRCLEFARNRRRQLTKARKGRKMDQQLLGQATVSLMESIEAEGKFENAKMIAVGIVAILEQDEHTFTRTYSTEKIHHRALGLFNVAINVIEEGLSIDSSAETEDDG